MENFDKDFDKLFEDHQLDLAILLSKSSDNDSLIISGYANSIAYDAACRVVCEWIKENLPTIREKVNQAIKTETEGEGPYLDLETA